MRVFFHALLACGLVALALTGVATARLVAAEDEPPVVAGAVGTDSTGATTDTATTDTTTTATAVADTTAPTIQIALPVDGATYFAGHTYLAAYTCADEADGSGIDRCVGTVDADAPIETATLGEHDFTVTATDSAGNEATASAHYVVAYGFMGFGDPLAGQAGRDQEPGRAIPVTFSLGADLGLDVLADGFPASRDCGGGALEPIATPGESALQYDADSQQYVIVWKTSRDWGGTCRRLVLRLRDGGEQSVEVTFRAPTQGQSPAASPGPEKDKGKPDKPETPGRGHGR